MMRPLNDRVAEAMRRETLGFVRPLWADWPEEEKTERLQRADFLIRTLRELGVFIQIEEVKRGR